MIRIRRNALWTGAAAGAAVQLAPFDMGPAYSVQK